MKKYLQTGFIYFLLSGVYANAQTKSVITSPNGGEVWTAGSIKNITWNSCLVCSYANVMLQYSIDNGTTWTPIDTVLDSNKSYAWTVPNTPSTICLVKILNDNGTKSDLSNNVFTITGSVGVNNETNTNLRLTIYPNPSNGTFSILCSMLVVQSLEIYNVLGEKFYSNAQQLANSVIDISSRPSGVYFIRIKTNKETLNEKIVIQK